MPRVPTAVIARAVLFMFPPKPVPREEVRLLSATNAGGCTRSCLLRYLPWSCNAPRVYGTESRHELRSAVLWCWMRVICTPRGVLASGTGTRLLLVVGYAGALSKLSSQYPAGGEESGTARGFV